MMAGIPKSSIVLGKKGLGSCDDDRTLVALVQAGDIVVFDFFGLGRRHHLVAGHIVALV